MTKEEKKHALATTFIRAMSEKDSGRINHAAYAAIVKGIDLDARESGLYSYDVFNYAESKRNEIEIQIGQNNNSTKKEMTSQDKVHELATVMVKANIDNNAGRHTEGTYSMVMTSIYSDAKLFNISINTVYGHAQSNIEKIKDELEKKYPTIRYKTSGNLVENP
jgi:hypothetical protein